MSSDQLEAHLMQAESSVVFDGAEFARLSFDERQLFGGDLDRGRTAYSGNIGHFYYLSGARFLVGPERVSLDAQGIWPDELQDAVGRLEGMFKALPSHNVRSLTLDFQAIFRQEVDGPTGLDFCEELIDVKAIRDVLGYELTYAMPRVTFLRGGLRHEVRLEPHFGTSGANLYLYVTVPQDVGPSDDISTMLSGVSGLRTYLTQLCSRVAGRFDGVYP